MTKMPTDYSLRRVAILVASLDETWAERILDSLPARQATAVRELVNRLTDIDPDELSEIAAEFRRSLTHSSPSSSTGVELDASLLERIDHDDYVPKTVSPPQGPFDDVSTDDVDTLAMMLDSEGPQTVAVVLSRLHADRAAEVLNKFSAIEQNEILERLASLDTTDQQAIQVVEAQVSQWLSSHRQRRQRMAAGKEMVERLMTRKMAGGEPKVVTGRLSRPSSPIAIEYPQRSTRQNPWSQPVRYEPLPIAPVAPTVPPPHPLAHLEASECVARLELLSEQQLVAALAACDSRTVLLSLVGASDKLMKRVTRGLSRHEGKLFRQQIRDIGPTRLSDILAAQQEVLHTAAQLSGVE